MADYTDQEFADSLRKAFVERGYKSIAVWSRREQFQLQSIGYGERMGWLTSEMVEVDDQSSYLSAKLTDAGKKHFGLED